ncbi:geranyl diphosphate/farnesyl diphosphate synthase [Azospirillaceae bacterium]
MVTSVEQAMAQAAAQVETTLESLLPISTRPDAPLWAAMRYGSLDGGKRLRPFLVLESAALFDIPSQRALSTAAAIELIHCYSLIHDDLPAMDNSDLRRGRPTVHRQFTEAAAILAGDGLLTLAFEVLADSKTHADPEVRCRLISALARAAGPAGMVGGQMMDCAGETWPIALYDVIRLLQGKAGALIEFACMAGALLAKADEPSLLALKKYAECLGLAFQIADDLLDVEGNEAEVGKSVGRDAAAGKATFVSLMGVQPARSRARRLAQEASDHLEIFGERAAVLKAVAGFVVNRRA